LPVYQNVLEKRPVNGCIVNLLWWRYRRVCIKQRRLRCLCWLQQHCRRLHMHMQGRIHRRWLQLHR